MSRSLNKVQLIGNVGKDPDIRTTSNGGKVAEFSLATSRVWNDAGSGRQEKTEWHRCIAWNARGSAGGSGQGLADIVERYVHKGDKLFVEGSIEYRTWQDQNNQTRYTTEIRVRELIMLSPRPEGEAGARTRSPARAAAAAGAGVDEDFEDFPKALEDNDDDLPF